MKKILELLLLKERKKKDVANFKKNKKYINCYLIYNNIIYF